MCVFVQAISVCTLKAYSGDRQAKSADKIQIESVWSEKYCLDERLRVLR